jgi:hypothetical protein
MSRGASFGLTPPSAIPGEVLEELVALLVGDIGEQRGADPVPCLPLRIARNLIAAQTHEVRVRNRERLAEPMKDVW